MMGHNICFKGVIWKIIPTLSLLPLLIWSTKDVVTELYASLVAGYFKIAMLSLSRSKEFHLHFVSVSL